MKSISLLLFGSMLFASSLLIPGCSGTNDPQPSAEETQLGKLTKTWKASEVKFNNVVQTTGYGNFKLTLSGTKDATSFGYATSGRPENNPWPSSGSWKFGNAPESSLVRDAGNSTELPMTYTVSANQLQINFTFSGTGYPAGRSASIEGVWVFTFSRE